MGLYEAYLNGNKIGNDVLTPGRTILDEIIPSEIRVRASDNLMWVLASNSSGPYSSWPSCIARPDGSLST